MDLRKIKANATKGHEFRLTDLAVGTYNKRASIDTTRNSYLKQQERMQVRCLVNLTPRNKFVVQCKKPRSCQPNSTLHANSSPSSKLSPLILIQAPQPNIKSFIKFVANFTQTSVLSTKLNPSCELTPPIQIQASRPDSCRSSTLKPVIRTRAPHPNSHPSSKLMPII